MARKKIKSTAADTEPLLESGSTRKRHSNAGDDSHATKKPRLESKTDYSRWRMRDDKGRLTWHYLEDDEELEKWPQTYADKYFLGLPLVCIFWCFRSCCSSCSAHHNSSAGSPRSPESQEPP